jgi:hypothetical protein
MTIDGASSSSLEVEINLKPSMARVKALLRHKCRQSPAQRARPTVRARLDGGGGVRPVLRWARGKRRRRYIARLQHPIAGYSIGTQSPISAPLALAIILPTLPDPAARLAPAIGSARRADLQPGPDLINGDCRPGADRAIATTPAPCWRALEGCHGISAAAVRGCARWTPAVTVKKRGSPLATGALARQQPAKERARTGHTTMLTILNSNNPAALACEACRQ